MTVPSALRTTTWAGALLAVAAAGPLISAEVGVIPLDHGAALPLNGTVPTVLWGFAQLAAFAVIALGMPQLVGGSRVGRIALLVLGARDLGLLLVGLLLPDEPVEPAWPVVVDGAAWLLLLAAGAVAAAAVLRTRVLPAPARVAVVAVAVLEAAMFLLSFIPLPLPAEAYILLAEPVWALQQLLLLLLGLALLLHGRRDALRHRWQVIRDAW